MFTAYLEFSYFYFTWKQFHHTKYVILDNKDQQKIEQKTKLRRKMYIFMNVGIYNLTFNRQFTF